MTHQPKSSSLPPETEACSDNLPSSTRVDSSAGTKATSKACCLFFRTQFKASASRRKFYTIIMLLFVIFCNIILVGSSFEQLEGERCHSQYLNTEGTCIDPRKCEHFRAHRRELNICSFNQHIPIVCCPKARTGPPSNINRPISTTLSPLENRFNERISQRSKKKLFD